MATTGVSVTHQWCDALTAGEHWSAVSVTLMTLVISMECSKLAVLSRCSQAQGSTGSSEAVAQLSTLHCSAQQTLQPDIHM